MKCFQFLEHSKHSTDVCCCMIIIITYTFWMGMSPSFPQSIKSSKDSVLLKAKEQHHKEGLGTIIC